VRVLFSTTANDGHIGPLLPFARACVAAGHEVRVAAPASFGPTLTRAGLSHEQFADAPSEVIRPIMAGLMDMAVDEADALVVREVFGRVDAQAALPGLLATIERWRPDVVVRETAEIASLVAAERFGVAHVHVCIGMHQVATTFADAMAEPLDELAELAHLAPGAIGSALAAERIVSLVPEVLDYAGTKPPPGAPELARFHEPSPPADGERPAEWGDAERPLVYATFGTVAGSLPPFAGVFREALDALAGLDASLLMTVGRRVDPDSLRPWPPNARVVQWVPQVEVLAHAAAMLGHGGFGTTMGAVAAGVPQVVVPLFTFDQKVNGLRVAAAGAGLTTERGAVQRASVDVPRLLREAVFTQRARRVAEALRALPPPSEAVPLLTSLVG
jgi:UDP:flavonoid glycosyltransferase YjiC (YdhE family)